MAVLNNEPKFSKRRKLGKNKKKAWRVSNVRDIEDFLEDERRQIRTGGIVSEKIDADLFVLDTGKDSQQEISSAGPKNKRSRKDKPLKCLALLQPSPHVKSVRTPDQEGFQHGKRNQIILQRLRDRSQSKVRLIAQDQKKQVDIKRHVERDRKRKLPEVDSDIWAEDGEEANTKLKPLKKLRKKPSALRATVIPHSGASVNPAYEDHQNLLLRAHAIEVEKEKEQNKIFNSLEAMFPSKAEVAMNASIHLEEMSAGLFDDSDDDDEEESSDEDGQISYSVGAPVRREDRKTKKQKRVKRELQKQMKLRVKENDVKKREHMVLRIPTLKSEINKAERKKQLRSVERQKKKQMEKFKTKRLNRVKFEELDPALKLSSELVASLREVKPEGHVMQDVYKSLQRRNIIEPRVKQKNKRTYKLKTFEKKGHKAVTL